MKNFILIILGTIIALSLIFIPSISMYNSLVDLEQQVDKAYSNIDTQLQRRSDLIPNLVNTVKGYASQEKEIYTEISNARTKLADASSISDQANADTELTTALSKLLMVVENYPELKSSQNFQDLTIQLEGTENRISVARQDYNTAVTNYNTKLKKFPTNLIANAFNFKEKELYKASDKASEVPSVDFNN